MKSSACIAAMLLVAATAPAVPRLVPSAPANGECRDEKDKPLAGVRVALYRVGFDNQKKLAETETKADGRFSFTDAPSIGKNEGLFLVLSKPGRGSLVQVIFPRLLDKPLHLFPAATLNGQVSDAAGKPIKGARVRATLYDTRRFDDILSAVTDSDGRFTITDLDEWKPDGDDDDRTGGRRLHVSHPDYATDFGTYKRVPGSADIVLRPGGLVEGRVIDKATGNPVAGVPVICSPRDYVRHLGGEMRTNADGRYRFGNLQVGDYDLYPIADERTCVSLPARIVAGKPVTERNLYLIEGGFIEGTVVDAKSGMPIAGTQDNMLEIECHGPARPGSQRERVPVDGKGRFRLRVPPGLNFPSVYGGTEFGDRVEDEEKHEKGVMVRSGEVTKVTFRIRREKD